MVIGTNYTYKV